jgi:hypothetical protein
MFYRWLLLVLVCVSHSLHPAITLKGDKDAASGETFSFAVQQAAISVISEMAGTNLFVAADPSAGGSDVVKEFAVSKVSRDTNAFVSLAPQTTTFNFDKDVGNPLYDQGIAYMKLFNAEESILAGAKERPVVVLENDKTTLYMLNNFTDSGKNIAVLSFQKNDIPSNMLIPTQNVPDATAAVTSGIVQIATANPFVFAAVAANGGSFGDVGSGIALGVIGQVGPENKPVFAGPLLVDAPTGQVSRTTGNRALALDVTSDELKISSDLASLGSVVDMVWHRNVGRLYIAVQATGGAAGTDGTRSIVTARVGTDKELILEPIVPTSAITGTDKIIGAVGAGAQVTAHKVREMFTSTALSYLVVQGGVGAPSATTKSVFALPLVSGSSTASLNGTIAAKDAEVTNNVVLGTGRFVSHIVLDAANTPAEMPLNTDTATMVGGGDILNGDITDLYVYGDTVFATVQTADAGQIPGVFYSQALFAQDGKIKGWTIWRRAVGLSDRTQSTFLDQATGNFYTLVANGASEVKTVKRTEWNEGDPDSIFPLTQMVDSYFAQQEAGVQGIHDFVVTSGALGTSTPGLLNISLLVATGYQRILLAQTSQIVAGAVVPIQDGDFGPLSQYDNGTITDTFPTSGSRGVGISGGALDDIGPIVAAEIGVNPGASGWLFVGGSNGVAVLSKADGLGWDSAAELSDGLAGLTAGMSFKSVGEFSQVRKLIYDDSNLYVITQSEIVRIDLTSGTPGLGTISATTLATIENVGSTGVDGAFLDAIVSEKLLIVATNGGLFRLADGLDARTVDIHSVSFKQIDTPEGIGPVRQLFAITSTGRAQDIARSTGGGMFYSLSAFRGKNQAQLHRFDVANVIGSSIGDTTVQRVRDVYVEDIPSYFASFGLFKSLFATDGTLFYGAQSTMQDIDAQLTVLASRMENVHTGSNFVSNLLIPAGLEGTTLLAGMIQNSATGTWLIAGDQGLRANE